MTAFRVKVRTPDGQEHTLYTQAETAKIAGQRVAASHKRPRLGKVVSTTAFTDDHPTRTGVWTEDELRA